MKLEFLGADHEVTGSCHYLKVGQTHVLIDCGMEQGADLYVNQEIPVNASEVDYVLVTHAHIDHSGLLPLLYNHGFRGKIYATNATTELCEIMLKDSAHIQQFEAEWKNRKARRAGRPEVVPLYDINDAMGVMEHFVPCPYAQKIEIEPGLTIRFVDAGHLLGSASIEVWAEDEDGKTKIVFSGDIGNGNKPLIKDPHFIEDADYVVMESTYGDRLHEVSVDYAKELAEVITETFHRGGNVVIPAFSVGRTQELLYFLRRIKTENLMKEYQDFEVYIDSPLAVEATGIFHKNVAECFDEEALELVGKGINPIRFDGLKMAITSDESKMINFNEKSKVIISASGMCDAGRIRHHLKHNLWNPNNTILFVGYQAIGTLGRALIEGATEVKLFGETVAVGAEIRQMPGISGHADVNGLMTWIKAFKEKPEKVFVTHGDDEVTEIFARRLQEELGLDSMAPFSGTVYDLANNTCIYEAQGIKITKASVSPKASRAARAFQKLVAMGQRLMSVIRKNEGMPNKDLERFSRDIQSLCDKWDRDDLS